MLERVHEEHRVVDQRVVEGATIRLVFEQRRTVDIEDLQANPAESAPARSGPMCALPFEKRTIAS